MEEFKLREKIHLVGIGGISMSALAQYFLAEIGKSTRLNSSH